MQDSILKLRVDQCLLLMKVYIIPTLFFLNYQENIRMPFKYQLDTILY